MRSNKGIIAILTAVIVLTVAVSILTGVDSASSSNGTVQINEVVASSKNAAPDDTGNRSDWIELYNPTDVPINLEGWGLSDSKLRPAKWAFPSVTLEPKSYLVVYCDKTDKCDPESGALHTNFKLSSNGAAVILTDNGGNIKDIIDYSLMASGTSLGRDIADASWKEYQNPTPGFENSDAGYAQYLANMGGADSPLVISEVMTANITTLADDYGDYSDWVEIHNTGDEPVDLMGYGFSDKAGNVLKWQFPNTTIEAGGYLVVYCSGKAVPNDPDDTQHFDANFKLSDDETVILATPSGRVIDSVQLQEASPDFSYARNASGVFEACAKPTPGYANNDAGFMQFMQQNPLTGQLAINEAMPSNSKYAKASDGNYYDWIEIKNVSDLAVNLEGYGLSDNTKNPAKWRFPSVVLQPGEKKTVLCSGLDKKSGAYLQTNFKLSSTGEVVGLFDPDGNLVDRINLSGIPGDMSYGRMSGKTGFYYFQTPTPGDENANGEIGFADAPIIELAAGIYTGAQQVTITAGESADEIRYTTDGSTPTQNSALYTGPINIQKTTAIRARAFKSGLLPSSTVTSTYFIDPGHTLPLISIVTDPDLLFDPVTGIYMLGPNPVLVTGSTFHYEVANYRQKGQASERPASFEVFDESGKQVFMQDIAIRIQGGFSRDNQQKPFAIYARSQYGPSTMNYPLFSDLPYTQYKSIQLRTGGQAALYAKINDAVVLDLVNGKINCLTQSIKPYVVYINGQYWGVYYMQEKRNQDFVTQHASVAEDTPINLIVGSGVSSDSLHLKNGTNEGYKELLNYVQAHDMSQESSFSHVAAQFDTDSFMDVMINQIYIANSDYYNMQFYQVPGGKWTQIFYDFCWTFGDSTHPTLERRMADTCCGSTMFCALLKYGPWKEAFLKRFAWTMENIYTPQRVLNAIDRNIRKTGIRASKTCARSPKNGPPTCSRSSRACSAFRAASCAAILLLRMSSSKTNSCSRMRRCRACSGPDRLQGRLF